MNISKKNQYDRIIEIYEKRLLDIQKNEKKNGS